ncbi:MAG: four helix bundle protein, partial [bacterium]|nr:four helix bundle protein [bacterium]
MEAIEEVALAGFTQGLEKINHIKQALSLTDTLKIFLQIAWELKLLEAKHYIEISEKMDTIGKMLG